MAYKVALIQNESEMTRYSWADVRHLLAAAPMKLKELAIVAFATSPVEGPIRALVAAKPPAKVYSGR